MNESNPTAEELQQPPAGGAHLSQSDVDANLTEEDRTERYRSDLLATARSVWCEGFNLKKAAEKLMQDYESLRKKGVAHASSLQLSELRALPVELKTADGRWETVGALFHNLQDLQGQHNLASNTNTYNKKKD